MRKLITQMLKWALQPHSDPKIKKMVFPWGAVITGAASLAGNVIQGIRQKKDERQLRQQRKLGELQMEQDKQMGEWNMAKQYDMWQKTGPVGQMEQYNKAGLNPGLIYGMSGGGGQTMGATGVGGVEGGRATQGSGDEENLIGMGIQGAAQIAQLSLLKAQKENIEADTQNKLAGAEFTSGVQSTKTKADTDLALQGVNASKARQIVDEGIARLNNQQEEFNASTMGARIKMQTETANKVEEEAVQAMIKSQIAEETKLTEIRRLKAESAGSFLQNELTGAQTELAKANKNLSQEQATKVVKEVKNMILEQTGKQIDRERLTRETTERLMQSGVESGAASEIARGLISIITSL